jgi:addiction module RelE/StbE family toxin
MKCYIVIKIKKSAKRDLKEIYEYIRKDSEYYANKTINKIEEYINNLKFFPYSGRKIPEINQENFLEIIYKKYRIMYKIESVNKISILRIFHSSRNFQIKI